MLNTGFEALLRPHLKYLKSSQELEATGTLKEYGLDSMASINLLLDIEDTYGVVMPDKYLTEETFSTAESLWDTIEKLRAETTV
ncbi:MAG TPA: phosphopantetheine-binding protein [Bacilli bacterium]|nr:phosphopantetheine-binding protein [Bacilli bacterium]